MQTASPTRKHYADGYTSEKYGHATMENIVHAGPGRCRVNILKRPQSRHHWQRWGNREKCV